jgi:hypothetical protein
MENIMSVDRFDLEQQILKCWNVTEDVDLLYRNLLDGPKEMTTDEIANALLGIQTLYEMKFNELFNTFEKLVHEKKIV